MKKKYFILYLLTAVSIVSMLLYLSYVGRSVISVEVFKLEPSTIRNTLTGSGKVEYAETKDVCYGSPAITKEVYVKVGDKVSVGDALIKLNGAIAQVSATPSIPNIPNIPNIQDFISSSSSYDSIINNVLSQKSSTCNYISDGTTQEICAPISGIVSSINVKDKQPIDGNNPIVVISNSNKMQVKLQINESQISEIKKGQDVTITGAGFKDKTYKGKIKNISTEAKQVLNALNQTSVVDVIVDIENVNDEIKPGFTARCKIYTSEEPNALVVPYDLVRADTDGEEYVYVWNKGAALKKYIKTGKEYPSGLQVVSGIEVGENIITQPDCVYEKARVKLALKDRGE